MFPAEARHGHGSRAPAASAALAVPIAPRLVLPKFVS